MNHALVRLIASDLDGTFLRDDRTVSGRTTGAVRAARASGVMVIAATGRQAQQLPAEVATSGIRHVVASNGAIGFDLVEQRVLFQDLLAPAAIAAIVSYLKERLPDVRFSAVRDHGARHAAEPGYVDLLADAERGAWWRIDTEPLADVVSEPTLKLTVRHPSLTADQLLSVLSESGMVGFHATTSGAPFLEIAGAGVTKASGVAQLCRLLEVEAAEVLAAGDAKNDIELLTWAGVGVAMGNAVPEARAAADWVTATNEEDGLAMAIEAVLTARASGGSMTEPALNPTEDETLMTDEPVLGDPVLSAWAAACVDHALLQFGDLVPADATTALESVRAWTAGAGSAEASRDAAFAAHLAARDLQDAGYQAAALAVRAASNAAASVDDPTLALQSAAQALEAFTLNSAPCEVQFNAESERRWQWTQLPLSHRARVFPTEPGEPAAASCALPS